MLIVRFTSMHSRLQTEQQVGQPGFSSAGHAGVGAAAVFLQIRLAGLGQRVADLVVLRDEFLSGGQRLAALRTNTAAVSIQTHTQTTRWSLYRKAAEGKCGYEARFHL